ncbi:MAG: UDP-2,3-diacylglucosamine diphosphatase LpxI [Alphaproteobacteria bacterium]|nr:UDP-2,3-diacylglucosamine diphosphatase LpxI [Alphaproteobacteria bacterium]
MTRLAILAGGGNLPTLVANAAVAQEHQVLMITFTGQQQPQIPEGIQHIQQALGAVGQTLKLLKQNDIEQVVLAGNIEKPKIFNLRPDAKGLALLARVMRHHDDELLQTVCEMLEEEGFQVVSAQEICPDLLVSTGILGRHKPTPSVWKDITQGQETLKATGSLDIGQAVVVKDKVLLGIEAIEGTEALLQRCASLRGEGEQGGVLVKLPKPEQTLQADVPTIGPNTIKTLAELGYAGVAIGAEKTLVLDKEETIKQANEAGIFIVGIES